LKRSRQSVARIWLQLAFKEIKREEKRYLVFLFVATKRYFIQLISNNAVACSERLCNIFSYYYALKTRGIIKYHPLIKTKLREAGDFCSHISPCLMKLIGSCGKSQKSMIDEPLDPAEDYDLEEKMSWV
jgi:hypothetical protein